MGLGEREGGILCLAGLLLMWVVWQVISFALDVSTFGSCHNYAYSFSFSFSVDLDTQSAS